MILSIVRIAAVLALAVLAACNKNDDSAPMIVEEEMVNGMSFSYPDSLILTKFRKAGSFAPNKLYWNGEKGTFSISSTTEILQRDAILFEESTGIIFWSRLLPLGEYDFTITAKNGNDSVSTQVLLKNEFDKGFFSGGFKTGVPDEIAPDDIETDYGLRLNEDKTITMTSYSDPTFSAAGTWQSAGSRVLVEFSTTLSGGEPTFMNGFLNNGVELRPRFEGIYGPEQEASGAILTPTGKFLFKWD